MKKRLLTYCFSLSIVTSLYSQNVGVGTSTPTSKLEVVGSETTLHGKNAAITIINTASSRQWNLRVGATGTFTPKNSFSIGDNFAYRFLIDSNGNVGIADLQPIAPLSISHEDFGNKIAFYGYGNNQFGIGVDYPLLQIYSDDDGSDIAFGYGSSYNFTERMRVKGNGNVGIGTTTPASKLEVNGETKTASLKVGNNGTSLSVVQKGTFTIGTSATAFKTVTVNFPNAFSSIPTLTATIKNDPGWNVGDTFVVSVRSISTTSVTFNILRVDVAGGWNQNPSIDWIAVQ